MVDVKQKQKSWPIDNSNVIDKDRFIAIAKKHCDTLHITGDDGHSVYAFLSSLYVANLITYEDLQEIGEHYIIDTNDIDSGINK